MEIDDPIITIITRFLHYKEVVIYPHRLRFYSLTADAGYGERMR